MKLDCPMNGEMRFWWGGINFECVERWLINKTINFNTQVSERIKSNMRVRMNLNT